MNLGYILQEGLIRAKTLSSWAPAKFLYGFVLKEGEQGVKVLNMNKHLKYVGQTFPIHDAPQKARGELVYVSDMSLPNMLYAKLLFSPIAHGLIKTIDTSRSEALPGVIKVFTYLNTPNKAYSRYRILLGG